MNTTSYKEMQNALKRIVTTEPVELDIAEVTLLSCEEYLELKDWIPPIYKAWWLCSSHIDDDIMAGVVGSHGSLDNNYTDSSGSFSVRPALRIRNLASQHLKIGDVIELAGYTWTVISDDMAICDAVVGKCCFRKDWRAPDAGTYDKSDIKRWIEAWAREKGIAGSVVRGCNK